MLTKDDCMLLAGIAAERQLGGEVDMPRGLLDLAARIAESLGDQEATRKLCAMRDAVGVQ